MANPMSTERKISLKIEMDVQNAEFMLETLKIVDKPTFHDG